MRRTSILINTSANRVETTIALKETEIQGIENRESKLIKKQGMSDKVHAAKQLKDHEELLKAISELENEKTASLSRQAETLLDSYGKEIATTEEHYRQLIFKQEAYAAKYPKLKAMYDGVIIQLEKEKQAALVVLRDKFVKEDAAKLEAINHELEQIALAGIKNITNHELAALDIATKEKLEKLDIEDQKTNELISQQQDQVKSLKIAGKNEEAKILEDSIAREFDMLDKSGQLRLAFLAGQKLKEQEIKENKAQKDGIEKAEIDVNGVGDKGIADDLKKISKQATLDELLYNQAIKAAKKTESSTLKIQADYDSKKAASTKALNNAKIKAGNSFLDATMALAKKDSAIYKAAFKAKQAIAIGEVTISAGKSIIKSFEGYASMPFVGQALAIAQGAMIGITAAVQIANIASQKPGFAKGGQFVSDGRGALLSGYSRHDDTNAQLRSGEAVVVSEAMQVPWARNMVSQINTMFGGRDFSTPNTSKGFAVGGIFTDGGTANRYYNQPTHDIAALGNSIAYQMINNFPPIYTSVRDINTQQSILSQTIDRVNL